MPDAEKIYHADHPGWDARECPLQSTVNPGWGAVATSPGYRCEWTGGHCCPGEHCAERLESYRESNNGD